MFAVTRRHRTRVCAWVLRIHGCTAHRKSCARSPTASTPTAFDAPAGRARLRLRVAGEGDWDATVERRPDASSRPPTATRPDARLAADAATWRRIADDVRGGMEAFSRGRLKIRDDLHLGVGFLAATSGIDRPGAARAGPRRAPRSATSRCCRPAQGDPVLLLHGLGATKASFLPTVAALAGSLPRDRDRPARLRRLRDAGRRRLRPAVLRPRGRRRARRARDRARARGRQQHGRPRRARARLRATPSAPAGWRCSPRRWRGCASAAGRRCCAPCAPSSGCSSPRRG